MDHSYIDREQIVDRYLLGTLSEDQVEQFEDHYFGCASCLDQLEAARKMQRAVKHLAAEEAMVGPTVTPHRIPPRPSRRAPMGRRARLALAAGLLLMVLGPATLLWWPGPGSPAIESNPLLFELSPTRSQASDPPSARIRVGPESRTVVLSLLLERAEFPVYAAALRDSSGATIWQGDDLTPNALSALSLAFPSAILPAGDYALEVEGLPEAGAPVPGTHYRFRVEDPTAP